MRGFFMSVYVVKTFKRRTIVASLGTPTDGWNVNTYFMELEAEDWPQVEWFVETVAFAELQLMPWCRVDFVLVVKAEEGELLSRDLPCALYVPRLPPIFRTGSNADTTVNIVSNAINTNGSRLSTTQDSFVWTKLDQRNGADGNPHFGFPSGSDVWGLNVNRNRKFGPGTTQQYHAALSEEDITVTGEGRVFLNGNTDFATRRWRAFCHTMRYAYAMMADYTIDADGYVVPVPRLNPGWQCNGVSIMNRRRISLMLGGGNLGTTIRDRIAQLIRAVLPTMDECFRLSHLWGHDTFFGLPNLVNIRQVMGQFQGPIQNMAGVLGYPNVDLSYNGTAVVPAITGNTSDNARQSTNPFLLLGYTVAVSQYRWINTRTANWSGTGTYPRNPGVVVTGTTNTIAHYISTNQFYLTTNAALLNSVIADYNNVHYTLLSMLYNMVWTWLEMGYARPPGRKGVEGATLANCNPQRAVSDRWNTRTMEIRQAAYDGGAMPAHPVMGSAEASQAVTPYSTPDSAPQLTCNTDYRYFRRFQPLHWDRRYIRSGQDMLDMWAAAQTPTPVRPEVHKIGFKWDNTIHPLEAEEEDAEAVEMLDDVEENGKIAAAAAYERLKDFFGLIPEAPKLPPYKYLKPFVNTVINQINPNDNPMEDVVPPELQPRDDNNRTWTEFPEA